MPGLLQPVGAGQARQAAADDDDPWSARGDRPRERPAQHRRRGEPRAPASSSRRRSPCARPSRTSSTEVPCVAASAATEAASPSLRASGVRAICLHGGSGVAEPQGPRRPTDESTIGLLGTGEGSRPGSAGSPRRIEHHDPVLDAGAGELGLQPLPAGFERRVPDPWRSARHGTVVVALAGDREVGPADLPPPRAPGARRRRP